MDIWVVDTGGYCEHSGIHLWVHISTVSLKRLSMPSCLQSPLCHKSSIRVCMDLFLGSLLCYSVLFVLVSVAYSLNYQALYYKLLESSRANLPTLLFSQNILYLLVFLQFHIHFRFWLSFPKTIWDFHWNSIELSLQIGKDWLLTILSLPVCE